MHKELERDDIEKDTPCIGVCILNKNDICIGCGRHIDEITSMGEIYDSRSNTFRNIQ